MLIPTSFATFQKAHLTLNLVKTDKTNSGKTKTECTDAFIGTFKISQSTLKACLLLLRIKTQEKCCLSIHYFVYCCTRFSVSFV